MFHKLLVFLFCFNSISCCFAQNFGSNNYFDTKINNINSITKDNNNFLWLGTQDGIFRFDSKTFQKFTVKSNKELENWQSLDFVEFLKNSNELFIGSTNKGIAIYNKLSSTYFFQPINLNLKTDVTSFSGIIKKGDFYFLCSTAGLIKFKLELKNKIYIPSNIKKISSVSISTSVFSSDEKLYTLDENSTVTIFDKNFYSILNKFDLNKHIPLGSRYVKLLLKSDTLYIATMEGLFVFKIYKNEIYYLTKHFETQNILSINKLTNGEIIFSTRSQLYQIKNNKPIQVTINNQNTESNSILNICSIFLSDSMIFLGGQNGLTILKSEDCFSTFKNTSLSKPIKHLYNISIPFNDKILLSAEEGLYKFNVINHTINKINSDNAYLASCPIGANEWIVSSTNSLYHLNNKNNIKTLDNVYPEFKKFKSYVASSIIKLSDSKYLLSSFNQKGLIIWDKKNRNVYTDTIFVFNNKPILQTNNSFKIDTDIFILSDTCLYKYDLSKNSKSVILLKYKNLSFGMLMDMVKIGKYYVFASYGNGIVITDLHFGIVKVLKYENGLSNNGVYKIFSTKNNAVIISTNDGLNYLDLKDFKVRKYFTENGIHNNHFEQYSGLKINEDVYLGGEEGLTKINTNELDSYSYPVLNTSFTNIDLLYPNQPLKTENLEFNKFYQISSNIIQTTIHFQAIQYPLSSKLNYAYRIKEISESWIDLKTQNYFSVIGLSPKKYTIEVKVIDVNGNDYFFPKMELHFLPKWYQTLLFKITLALLIAGLLYVLYSFRIKQLKKVLAVRQKISQNLHDDIGSTLSAINMYTQVAKLQPQENHFMDSIEENTKEVLGKLDDIIWSTNPKNDKVQNLVERMENFAVPLCRAKNVTFVFNHSLIDNSNRISETTRQNLFVMFKEAVNNALKYAQCKTCTVSLEEKNKNIYCSITDDGIGFDTTLPTERNGLLNMQLRAKEIKGSCKIESITNKGTVVVIALPI